MNKLHKNKFVRPFFFFLLLKYSYIVPYDILKYAFTISCLKLKGQKEKHYKAERHGISIYTYSYYSLYYIMCHQAIRRMFANAHSKLKQIKKKVTLQDTTSPFWYNLLKLGWLARNLSLIFMVNLWIVLCDIKHDMLNGCPYIKDVTWD